MCNIKKKTLSAVSMVCRVMSMVSCEYLKMPNGLSITDTIKRNNRYTYSACTITYNKVVTTVKCLNIGTGNCSLFMIFRICKEMHHVKLFWIIFIAQNMIEDVISYVALHRVSFKARRCWYFIHQTTFTIMTMYKS